MLQIAVYDSGYGGENFADRLEQELPVVKVIRIIDWRHATEIQSSAKTARRCAEVALHPYIGKVDLIIFANHLLTTTSLKYFQKKYENQKFTGLQLEHPCTFTRKNILILTTKAVSRTFRFHCFVHFLKMNTKTLVLDSWPSRIDDGELSFTEIKETLQREVFKHSFQPDEIILACSQFSDILEDLKKVFGKKVKFHDGSRDVISSIYKMLHIKGITGK
ncbi:hypothetical protein IKG38_00415 [Candidatus Saccharibacteria bacterium]|nr:hypothetical protein [Candidatus Saccharibacteria bacterium]